MYIRHTWSDYESGGTMITAEKLNEMEQGIADANEKADNAPSLQEVQELIDTSVGKVLEGSY